MVLLVGTAVSRSQWQSLDVETRVPHRRLVTYSRRLTDQPLTYRGRSNGLFPYIEAVSARLAYTIVCPMAHAMKPQTSSAVPPSVRTKLRYLIALSNQVHWIFSEGNVRKNAFPARNAGRCEAEHC
jgi:hypothetical protein